MVRTDGSAARTVRRSAGWLTAASSVTPTTPRADGRGFPAAGRFFSTGAPHAAVAPHTGGIRALPPRYGTPAGDWSPARARHPPTPPRSPPRSAVPPPRTAPGHGDAPPDPPRRFPPRLARGGDGAGGGAWPQLIAAARVRVSGAARAGRAPARWSATRSARSRP